MYDCTRQITERMCCCLVQEKFIEMCMNMSTVEVCDERYVLRRIVVHAIGGRGCSEIYSALYSVCRKLGSMR